MTAKIKVNVQVVCSLVVEVEFADDEITVAQMREEGRTTGVGVVTATLKEHLPDHVTVACIPNGHYRSLTVVES